MKNIAFLRLGRSIFCVNPYTQWTISFARLLCIGLLAVVGMVSPAVEAQTAHFSWGQTTIGSGLQNAAGVAVDGDGNVYIADGAHNRVLKETPSSGSYIQTTVVSGLNTPVGLAVDGAGNVYTSTGGNQVVKETLSGGSYTQSVVASGLSNPNSVAVDGSGNVFIVDVNNHRVLKETPSGGSYIETTIGTGLSIPTGVAVDGSGNVYIFDRSNDQVVKETLSGGTYTQTSTSFATGSISNDAGKIAVGPSGNIYVSVSDSVSNSNFVLKGTPSGGSYTLTAVGSGLSGVYGVAADGNGNVYIADSGSSRVIKVQTSSVDFGTKNVGSTSAAVTLTFTFDTAGTLGSVPSALTQGAAGLDFADAGTGSCTTNGTAHSYAAGDTCTVDVVFTPKFAGVRYGAVTLSGASGTTIATGYVHGIGQGPQLAFGPGTQRTLGSGLTFPNGGAVDGSGNVYVADAGHNMVKQIVAVGGVIPASPTIRTLGSGFNSPQGVAVDGSGNVYVADTYNNAVKEIVAVGGVIPASPTIRTLANGFNLPYGVAVDGSGNVYVADTYNNAVKEIVAVGGVIPASPTIRTLGSGFNGPQSVAVDGSGNVYVADSGHNQVTEIVAVGGVIPASPTIRMLGSGFSSLSGVAVDGSGNVYVADFGNDAVKKIVAVGGVIPASPTIRTLGSNFSPPVGVTVDGSGNVYVVENTGTEVKMLDVADAPSLAFASTVVGATSTDSPRTVTVENIGNADLSFLVPATGMNPSIATGFTLGNSGTCPQLNTSSSVATLAQGTSCTMLVSFSPTTAGSNSGSLVLTDDNLNASPSTTQTIALSGTATTAGPATHFSVTGPNLVVSYLTYNFTVTALDASNNVATGYNGTAAFSSSDFGFVNTGSVTLVNGVGSFNGGFKTAGSQTLVATDTANSAITGSANFIVQPGPAVNLNISAPATAVAGTAVSLTVFASDLYGNVATSYTGTVHFTSSDGSATLPADATLTGGTGTFSATLKTPGSQTITATDAVNSLSRASGGITVAAPNFVVTTAGDGIAPAINLAGPFQSYNGSGEIDGFAFKATKNTTVSSLGIFAGPSLTLPGGSSFAVGLWTDSGTLLASATVTPSDTAIGSFYYHSVTPVALTAGQSYVVGAKMGSGVMTYYGGTYTMADGIQFQGNRWDTSSSLAMPTSYDGTPNDPGYLGASFLVGGGGTGGASDCTPQTTPGTGTDASCSLRDALLAAASAGAGNITFDATAFATAKTIGVGSGTLTLPSNTAVQGRTAGSGASLTNLVTVSGGSAAVFTVGSGVVNASISNLIITGGNSSSGGGGIHNDGVLTVSNSAITGNTTSSGEGGGILNLATLTVKNSSITGNTVASIGAGLYNPTGSTATLINSTISGNTAPASGGGIYNNGGTLVITGSTVSGNSVGLTGGGILSPSGSLTIANSIVAGNSATISADISGAYTDGGGNIASSDSAGTSSIAIDLAPLGSYGGPLQTMLPLPGSPAICAAVAANIPGGITTDERGFARTTTYGSTPCADAGAAQSNYAVSFTTQPSNVLQNTAMSPAPAVTLMESGTPFVAPSVSIPLSLTVTGVLSGGLASTTTGVATYTALKVDTAGTGHTLVANLVLNSVTTTAISAASGSFDVTSAIAQLAFGTAPVSTITAGGNAGSAVTVKEEGSGGSLVATATDSITLLVAGPNSYTKSYTATAVNGVATFDLSSDALTTSGGYDYTASLTGATSATASATVSADSASTISVISGSGQSAVIGAAFTNPLSVKVVDVYNNPVAGVTVTFAGPGTGAGATLSTAAATASDGTASATATANGTVSATAYAVTASVAGATTPASFTLTNTKSSTSVTVTPSATSIVYGQPVTINATVTPGNVAGSVPSGSVTFYDGATALIPNGTLAGAAASYTVSVPAVGSRTYGAQYAGDTNFIQSSLAAAASPVVIGKASSTLTPSTISKTLAYNEGGTISVSVVGQFSGTGIVQPAGSITYTIGSSSPQSAAITAGTATVTLPTAQATGTFTITVNYAGDGNYNPAAAATIALTVNQATLTIAANNSTRVYGAANPAFTGTLGGAVNGDIFTESFATTAGTSSPVGSYAIVPSVTGANLSSYTQSITNGTLTITQATSSTVLTASPIASGQSLSVGSGVAFIATVASSTSGTPTGAVNFLDGTAILASVPISGGVASYTTSSLSAGPHTITAVYAGDTNFTGSASNPVNQTASDFTLSFSSPQTILPGHSATFTLTATPVYGSYNYPITLSASGLPPGATATFSTTSLTPGSNAVTATLTIQTPAQLARQESSSGTRYGVPILLGLLLPLAGIRRGRRKLQRYGFLLLFAVLSFGVVTGLSGCGAGGFFNQVAQTYNVTVTGSSGTVQRSTTVALTVQ